MNQGVEHLPAWSKEHVTRSVEPREADPALNAVNVTMREDLTSAGAAARLLTQLSQLWRLICGNERSR